MKRRFFFVWILSAVGLMTGCLPSRPRLVVREYPGMGTLGSVTALSDEEAFSWAARCAQITREWEERLSVFLPNSDLARINAAAGKGVVAISPETRWVLEHAIRLARESGGAFDPTVGPLMDLWGFRRQGLARKPMLDEIAASRERVGYHKLVISTEGCGLEREGMALDLGGIGKGVAVDRCWEELRREAKGRPFLVNLGGNIRASGRLPTGREWSIGIRDPFDPGRIVATISLEDGKAVATSGHYERFVVLDGERWAHIMDPRTGMPVRGMASVTVVADSAEDADGLSTTLFVMGREEGEAFLRQTGRNAAVLYIPDQKPLHLFPNASMKKIIKIDSRDPSLL